MISEPDTPARVAVGIRPWIFEFFHELRDPVAADDPDAVQAHVRWYLDLWRRAEERGYEGIFFSEHHFGAAYSPSPNLLVAHVAARTARLRLGVLGTVTPYATPWRIVEEFAMLDHLTGGRFEPGIVSGIPPELDLVGIDPGEAAARHHDALELLAATLLDPAAGRRPARPTVSQHGRQGRFSDLRITPPMLRHDAGVWTAARTVASAERAGSLGFKLCGGFVSAEFMATMFDAYRVAAAQAGRPCGPERLAIRRLVAFVDDPADQELGRSYAKRALIDVLEASAPPVPPWAAVLDRPGGVDGVLSDDEFVAGTPAQVADELVRQCTLAGAGHALVAFADVDPVALDRAHARFADGVIPVLRAADVGAGAGHRS